jgi:hypothetical protein
VTIGTLLYSALSTNSGITAIASTRIYPLLLPDNNPTLPAITYQRISNTGQDGTSNRKETRYQINCWALKRAGGNGYQETQQLAAAVKAALEEYYDVSTEPAIAFSRVVNELDDYDDEAKVFRTILDVILTTTGDWHA